MADIKTLNELTGQESGIVVYGNKNVLCCNWRGMDNYELPVLSPIGGLMGWRYDRSLFDGVESRRVDDIRTELPGTVWCEDGVAETDMDILWDYFYEISKLFIDDLKVSGTVYEIGDICTVIAPDEWV